MRMIFSRVVKKIYDKRILSRFPTVFNDILDTNRHNENRALP